MLSGIRDVVDDVVQSIMLKVLQSQDQLKNREKPEPWVRQIARNHCMDVLRAKARQESRVVPTENHVCRIEQGLVEGMDIRRVLRALKTPREQVVLELWLEEYSVKRTAEVIGMSIKTVQRDRSSIQSTVRRLYEKRGVSIDKGKTGEEERVN